MIHGSMIGIMWMNLIILLIGNQRIILAQVVYDVWFDIKSNSILKFRKQDTGKRTMHNKIQGPCVDHDTIGQGTSNSWRGSSGFKYLGLVCQAQYRWLSMWCINYWPAMVINSSPLYNSRKWQLVRILSRGFEN